jgi:hypothetical protein
MINLPLVSKIYILLLLLVQYLKENVLHQHDKIQLPSNRQIYQSSKLRLALVSVLLFGIWRNYRQMFTLN